MNKHLTSWQTSLGGVLALIGGTFALVWPEHAKVGVFMQTIGTGLIGLAARDNKVTSEEATGIWRKAPEPVGHGTITPGTEAGPK